MFFKILLIAVGMHVMAETHGVLRVVQGDVKITSGKSGQTLPAKMDQNVMVKDTIVTGKNSQAKAIMDDNTAFNVGPESSVEIREYVSGFSQTDRHVLMNLIAGRVRFDVRQKFDGEKNKFIVRTPIASAGVRGTDFLVDAGSDEKTTVVTTFRGTVDFGATGPSGEILDPVHVLSGHSSRLVRGAKASMPASVPKSKLEKLEKESRAETDQKTAPEHGRKAKKERPHR